MWQAIGPVTAFRNRLGAKILAVMGGVLIVTSLACLGLLIPVYRQELVAERQTVSSKLGAMLQITLENAMLKRDIDGLREIVTRLGQSKDVSAVMILSPDGEVRFSSAQDKLGQHYRGLAEVCPGCGLTGARQEAGAAFVRETNGHEVLRSVNVVGNREPCVVCHGPVATHPVNGFLVVDYTAADLKHRAARTAALLGSIGFVIVFGALAATWYALRRLVFVPVQRITCASRALAAGDLSARADLATHAEADADEMATLGRQFNEMASRLEDLVATLRERDAFQQALIDAVPDGIRVIDKDYAVLAANKVFCDQVGIKLHEVLGRRCYASSHQRTEPCIPTMVVCPIIALANGNGPVKSMHTHVDARTGANVAVEVIAAPLEYETRGGRRRCIVESVRDLTRQVEVSQEQRLSEIGLLATGVAHEIHNPLASISLGLKMIGRSIESGEDKTELTQYLAMIDAGIDRCIEVTERLMWLSQPPGEHGALVDLDRVVHDVVALLHYDAEVRKLTVTTDVPATARIIANSHEMGMVLLNLIQNAFHASRPNGVITVTARVTKANDVDVAVTDTGVGISAENIDNIFHPFWSRRADGSTGSGLGLAICKSLVAKWQGRIEVESAPDQGTRFHLVFPHADKIAGAWES